MGRVAWSAGSHRSRCRTHRPTATLPALLPAAGLPAARSGLPSRPRLPARPRLSSRPRLPSCPGLPAAAGEIAGQQDQGCAGACSVKAGNGRPAHNVPLPSVPLPPRPCRQAYPGAAPYPPPAGYAPPVRCRHPERHRCLRRLAALLRLLAPCAHPPICPPAAARVRRAAARRALRLSNRLRAAADPLGCAAGRGAFPPVTPRLRPAAALQSGWPGCRAGRLPAFGGPAPTWRLPATPRPPAALLRRRRGSGRDGGRGCGRHDGRCDAPWLRLWSRQGGSSRLCCGQQALLWPRWQTLWLQLPSQGGQNPLNHHPGLLSRLRAAQSGPTPRADTCPPTDSPLTPPQFKGPKRMMRPGMKVGAALPAAAAAAAGALHLGPRRAGLAAWQARLPPALLPPRTPPAAAAASFPPAVQARLWQDAAQVRHGQGARRARRWAPAAHRGPAAAQGCQSAPARPAPLLPPTVRLLSAPNPYRRRCAPRWASSAPASSARSSAGGGSEAARAAREAARRSPLAARARPRLPRAPLTL